MKGNNQIFHNNFPEDKMTESVKLANYRGSAHEGHLQHFEKYAGGGNQDNNDQIEDREDKSSPREGIDIAAHTRQIKTEYSQVSHIESGFQKSKTNQAEMLKQLRSQYDHLKNFPLDQQEERAPSSNSNSQQEGTSEVASSIPTSKHRKRNKEAERDRDYGQREERIWIVEKKQYQSIVASCQQKIEELLHAEMGYKRTIHQLRSSIVTPKPNNQNNKAEQLMVKELQNALREEKQKNKYLEIELEKTKNFSKQQNEKLSRVEGQFSSRTRQIYQYEEDKRKLEDLVRLEREKFQNSEIEKRKYQMEFQILKKDKQLQNIRLARLNDHEKVVAEMNLKSEIKKYEEEIELKDRRYKLLLEEYQKLKRDTHQKKDKKETYGTFQMFDEIKNLIQQNRNTQNEEFSKTMNLLISKMEEENSEVESSNNFDLENERLKAEIKILRNQIDHLHERDNGDTEVEHLKQFYENEILALKDVIELLEKKLKEKQQIHTPFIPPPPASPTNGSDSAALRGRISELEKALAESQSISAENQKTYLMYKAKWEQDQNQLRALKRRLDEVTFQLEKCSKQFQFQTNMMRTESETNARMLRADLDKANVNVAYWQKEFENMKRFYETKIEEKNRLIEQSSNTASVQEVKKQYDRNFQIARAEYERQIASLTEKISDHPSYSVEYEELRKKHTQLQMIYFDLKNNSRKSWQLNEGIDHLWGIKETQYGNVNEILRQVKNRPVVNYASTTYQSHPQPEYRQNVEVETEFRSRQPSQVVEEPRFIIRESQSSGIANRNSAYEPALGANRQTVYSVRESGSGSGYAIRESGSMARRSGYGEPGYTGGLRMSSAYGERPQYIADGYIRESEQQYQDEGHPDHFESIQKGYGRESGYGLRRSSGTEAYYMDQPVAYEERGSGGFRIRQSSGYGDDYAPDYGARQSRPYQPVSSGPYDMSYDMRQSHPYNRQPQTPGFADDQRISNSYYNGVRESGYEPVILMESRSGYGGNSVYESYRGQRDQPTMVRV